MNKDHRAALDAEAREIDRLLVQPQPDPLEREMLVAAVSLGQRLAEYLQCEVADEGSWVDTGTDGSGYDCHVTVKGREYHVHVSPGSTKQELAQFEQAIEEEATVWDLLCPRVIEALRTADKALADEFERYVTTPGVLVRP